MLTVKGKFNTAKVFTDNLEELARAQISAVCDAQYLQGSKIRIMPDVHAGKGCTIGTTMTIHGCVVPNMVGVDIGCGMETLRLSQKEIDFNKLDKLIRKKIPYGRAVRKSGDFHPFNDKIKLGQLCCIKNVKLDRAKRSIGTLGGGNHFIEIDRDDENNFYLVVHSGSRHLGTEVAELYQKAGYAALCDNAADISKDMAYVTGRLFRNYIADMKITQQFAALNRKAIADIIVNGMEWTVEEKFTTVHNYIDTDEMMLRKGAVAAHDGQKLLIPINMRDGSLVCVGKGNADWNFSAPHGAGRIMSRAEAFKKLSLDDYKASMKGVFTTCVEKATLDEAPMAYKNKDDIIKNIAPAATVLKTILPVYNFKASD